MNPTAMPLRGWPNYVLRLEAAFVLIASIIAYYRVGGSWIFFLVMFLSPDLSMLGYLAGKRTGALIYNLAHTYVCAIVLGGVGFFLAEPWIVWFALIWTGHIGADRMLGYGLKYAEGFSYTHLGIVGAAARKSSSGAGEAN